MRDRLIEMIKDVAEDVIANCGDRCDKCTHGDCVGKLADHLLAEGVIVLPCKVGDTVYVIQLGKIYERRVNEICIRAGNNNVVVLDRFINGFHIQRYEAEYFNAFGKTVFLTREEAEKALEGRGNDNLQQTKQN